MDSLPQELINRIVWFAERYPDQDKWFPAIGQFFKSDGPPSQFPRLAGLNRVWKEAVEAVTFRQLGIKSDDLDSLQAIVTGNRRKHLTRLSFTALLPEYSEEACARKESRVEQHTNNEAFTKGICDFFAVLRTWEDHGVRSALWLDISPAASLTDSRVYVDGPARDELMYEVAIGKRKDILSDRWVESRLHLLQPGTLPTLSIVQRLTIIGNGQRKIARPIATELARVLPELNAVEWEFEDYEDRSDKDSDRDSLMSGSDSDSVKDLARSPKVRGEDRTKFADELTETELCLLRSADIVFYHVSPVDQRHTRPSIVPGGLTYDPLSTALRNLSQRLTTLTLSARLDSTLFWPSQDKGMSPSWPQLKSLDVTFDMVAPSGEWYFTGPRPVDHTHDDVDSGTVGGVDARKYSYRDFRIHPDPQTFDPFLGAFAKAVAQMPVLEFFMLTSDLVGRTGRLHISYHAPGKKAEWGDEGAEDVEHRRIYYACEVGKVWVPEVETAEGLRRAGKQKFGGEAIERYVGSQYY
ncbi:hypothetical protein J1614_002687 [Plenodomus biglobosus]|nr:hypothetical protein J1614_002687 [Plenodomus biglobosus]